MAKTRHSLKVQTVRAFGKKADKGRYQHALLGHPDGTLEIDDKPGYGWGRLGGQNGRVIQVYLRGVLPAYDLPVVVTQLPHRPSDYGVVDLDIESFAGTGSGESATGYPGTAYLQRHAAQHNYLAGDQTYTHIRQWRPLRVYPYSVFNIYCEQGFIIRNGTRINVAAQVIDISSHVPSSGARYVLITINPSGTLTATSGTDVSSVLDLTLANIPTTPVGHYPLAAVRTYVGQSAVRETASVTDIVDLRYPQEFAASSPVMYETVTNADAGSLTVGMPVYISGANQVTKAKADAYATCLVAGLMTGTVASAATGQMQLNARITATTAQWDAVTDQSGGLTVGAYYYLSAATAGHLTTTAPSDPAHFPLRVGLALSTTEMLIDIDPSNAVLLGENTVLDDVVTVGDFACNYTSLDTAVDNADLAKLILMTPGTYTEQVDHAKSDALNLSAIQPMGQNTILSFTTGTALTLSSGSATISNLKITGGDTGVPTVAATSTGAASAMHFLHCDIITTATTAFDGSTGNYYWTWFDACRIVGAVSILETAYFTNCLIYGNVTLGNGGANAYSDPELSTPLVEIRGGKIVGDLTVGANVTVVFKNLPQITGTVANSGTIVGKYQDSNGLIVSVVEGDLLLSDVTTANSNTTRHGLLKKLSGLAEEYLGGDGDFHPIPTSLSLFLESTDSDISGYKTLQTGVPSGAKTTAAASITGVATTIEEFALAAGIFDFISAQVLHIHIHAAKTAGTKTATLFARIYHRTSGGTETLLGTSESTVNLAGSETAYDLSVSVPDQAFASTDRFVAKFLADPGGAGTDPTVTIYYQGDTTSRVEIGTSLIRGLAGGTNTELQYNDAGILAGIPLLYDDSTPFLTYLKSPTPAFVEPGNSIKLEAGSVSGVQTTDAGDFDIIAGSTELTGAGGNINLTAGDSVNGAAGDINLKPGTSSADGNVRVIDPTSNLAVAFDASAITSADKTVTFQDDNGTLAFTSQLVTNGDSHDHSGGDGAQIDHGGLAGLGDNDHTQYYQSGDSPTFSTISAPASAGSAVFALDVSAGSTLVIANDGTAQPTGAANFSGLFIITDTSSTGAVALFTQGGASVIMVSGNASVWSTTQGTAGHTNVYLDGSSIITIENKSGGSVTYRVVMIRTRSAT